MLSNDDIHTLANVVIVDPTHTYLVSWVASSYGMAMIVVV
jgi:hypothetical protein